MASAVSRTYEVLPLPPVSHAHQEGLRALVGQLQATGQEVALLAQLAECLPRLRAGLNPSERQRIDDLDSNEQLFTTALDALHEAIDGIDWVVGAPEQPLALVTLLVDAPRLRQLTEAARRLAESANDLALRASARSGMLE